MRLIGREKLLSLSKQDRMTAGWITAWIAEVRDAHWKQPADITRQFPRVCRLPDGKFLFPVPRQQVGILVIVTFYSGVALIVALKAFDVANEH